LQNSQRKPNSTALLATLQLKHEPNAYACHTSQLFLGKLLTLSLNVDQLAECYTVGNRRHWNHPFRDDFRQNRGSRNKIIPIGTLQGGREVLLESGRAVMSSRRDPEK
jgi:hypothetical protein